MTRVSLLLLAAAACGKSSGSGSEAESFAPTARIDGAMVVIEARCQHGDFEAGGKHAYCDTAHPATIRLPAATLGIGPQTIAVTYEHGSRDTRTVDVSVTIPAAATGPYISVESCVDDYSAHDSVHLDLLVDGKAKVSCSSFHGARAKLEIRATPGGKLTLGDGKPVTVPSSGELSTVAELVGPIMALKLDDFAVSGLGAKSPPLELPYVFDAGGKQITGTLSFEQASFEMGKLFHNWLHDLVDGKIDRPEFTPPKPGERKTILFLDERNDVSTTDRRGTVKELDYVATMKETGRKEAGTCDFQTGGKTTTAKRIGVDSEVTVTSLADGKVVTTKAFPAPSGCPIVAMLDPAKPETAVIVRKEDVMTWLETLAKP